MMLHPSMERKLVITIPHHMWHLGKQNYRIGDKNKEHITGLHTAFHPNMQVTVAQEKVIPLKP